MREHLFKLLIQRSLPDAPRSEDFFSAGPMAPTRRPANDMRQEALLADIRRRARHGRHGLAA